MRETKIITNEIHWNAVNISKWTIVLHHAFCLCGGSTPAPGTSISPWKAAWCSTPRKWHRRCVRYRDKRSEIWAHGHTGAPRATWAKPSKSAKFEIWHWNCQFKQKRTGFSMFFIFPQILLKYPRHVSKHKQFGTTGASCWRASIHNLLGVAEAFQQVEGRILRTGTCELKYAKFVELAGGSECTASKTTHLDLT